MEPVQPNHQTSPEQGPKPAVPEQLPTPPVDQPAVSSSAPASPPPAPAPVANQSEATPPAKPAVPTANTPATAEDVDVIEKEWVDAAQAVVQKNAEDPYKEEEGFEDLQVDYLKKRYGKDIKKPDQ